MQGLKKENFTKFFAGWQNIIAIVVIFRYIILISPKSCDMASYIGAMVLLFNPVQPCTGFFFAKIPLQIAISSTYHNAVEYATCIAKNTAKTSKIDIDFAKPCQTLPHSAI